MPIIDTLNRFGHEITETLTRKFGIDNCKDLKYLVKSGKVKLHNFHASLTKSDEYTLEFFNELKRTVSDTQAFPLFDDLSNDLIRTAVKSHVITLNDANEFNIQHAGLTSNLLISLPSFEFATASEIVDIRRELEAPLVRFRKKMLSYNGELQSMPWDDTFNHECFRLYQSDVAPCVLEIDELTREASFIKNLGYSIFSDASALKAASGLVISIAAAGAISAFSDIMSSDFAMVAAGGAYAASKIACAYKEYREKQSDITKKDMYFYYKAGRLLDKKA